MIETQHLSLSSFSGTYMAIKNLHAIAQNAPSKINLSLIQRLEGILRDRTHSQQTCALFLYKLAAETLSEILVHSPAPELTTYTYNILNNFALQTFGNPCMATAQAMGTLPLNLPSPNNPEHRKLRNLSQLRWEDILKYSSIAPESLHWTGRSLIASSKDSENVLVLKLAKQNDLSEMLFQEVSWMDYLQDHCIDPIIRFDLPRPLIKEDSVFKIKRSSLPKSPRFQLHSEKIAIAYVVHKDYFTYPNDLNQIDSITADQFLEIISRNSYLLGWLSAKGILHTAVIPLFHNRTQQNRRHDQGFYLWTRKGRLDKWLHSTLYPNFGLSGLRDFEHFISYQGNKRLLFREIGNQILSLLLVCASYFRFQNPQKVGLDEQGNPVDARYLFDKDLFKELLKKIFENYYQGFVGKNSPISTPFYLDQLVERMIEEMGIDRYMSETLRVEDQLQMSDLEFQNYLLTYWSDREFKEVPKKGETDIILFTGPHLGEFNSSVSIPEMIDFVAGVSSTCIASKFLEQKSS